METRELNHNKKVRLKKIFYPILVLLFLSLFFTASVTKPIDRRFFFPWFLLLGTLFFTSLPYKGEGKGKKKESNNPRVTPYYYAFSLAFMLTLADLLGQAVLNNTMALVSFNGFYLLLLLSLAFLFFMVIFYLLSFVRNQLCELSGPLPRVYTLTLALLLIALIFVNQRFLLKLSFVRLVLKSAFSVNLILYFILFVVSYLLSVFILKKILNIYEPLRKAKPIKEHQTFNKITVVNNLYLIICIIGGASIFFAGLLALADESLIRMIPYFYLLIAFLFFITYPYQREIQTKGKIEVKKNISAAISEKSKIKRLHNMPYIYSSCAAFMLGILDFYGIPVIHRIMEWLFSPGEGFRVMTQATSYSYKPGQKGISFQRFFVNEYTGESVEFNIFVTIIFQMIFYFIVLLALYFIAFLIRKYILRIYIPIPVSSPKPGIKKEEKA